MLTFEITSSNIRNAQKTFAPVRFAALAGLTALAITACSTSPGRPPSGTAGTSGGAGSGAGTSGTAGMTSGAAGTVGAAGDTAGTSGMAGTQGTAGAAGAAGSAGGSAGSTAGAAGGAPDGGAGAGGATGTAGAGACNTDPGYALQFRGSGDDRVQATIAKLPTGRAPRTIELWAWFDGTPASWVNEKGLFETGDKNGSPAGGCHEFALNSTKWAGGQALPVLHPYGNCDPVDNFFQLPAGTFPANSVTGWVHISFGYDSQANNFQFTINGNAMLTNGPGQPAARTHPENNWPAPGNWSTTSYPAPQGNLLTIGTTPQFVGPPGWQGKIDEFRVWSVFRTADQIKANMRVILKGTEPGLIAYYKFDENKGMSTADATGDVGNVANFTGADKATWPMWTKSDIPGTFTCAP